MIAVMLVRSVARTRTYINNNTHRGRKKRKKREKGRERGLEREREKKRPEKKYYLALLPQAVEREGRKTDK